MLDESIWRNQFAATGGVAVMGPKRNLDKYTIGSGGKASVAKQESLGTLQALLCVCPAVACPHRV